MRYTFIALMALILLGNGCSWKAYDAKATDDYHKFWQDDDHKRNSIAYPFSRDFEEERKPYNLGKKR